MSCILHKSDVVGLIHPSIDAHTLGLSSVASLLSTVGIRCRVAGSEVCQASLAPMSDQSIHVIKKWILSNAVTVLGFSYRLEPLDAISHLGGLLGMLKTNRLFACPGAQIHTCLFAGLPEACQRVHAQFPEISTVFQGDETPSETLSLLGIASGTLTGGTCAQLSYDEDRMLFAKDLLARELQSTIVPVDRALTYPEYGTRKDSLIARMEHASQRGHPPLMRAHVGPYHQDRGEALRLFGSWCNTLASGGYLDVLSIGTSQLSQSDFNGDWTGKADGGGVPIQTPGEFAAVYEQSRPLLLRSYAGTTGVPAMAAMLEHSINTAWHALSLWWFCQLDGRGPNSLLANLVEHSEALRFVASSGKPFEANVPHHFAFRGADDLTCVVSAVLAARFAKAHGVRHYIQQIMLNTPKHLWGIKDLAKARAIMRLVRKLEGPDFRVILQPRGGLDYFSPNEAKAREQLAAVSAMMCDIEPEIREQPPIVHVVSYSEGTHLASPDIVEESIRITRAAMCRYAALKRSGEFTSKQWDEQLQHRTRELVSEAELLLKTIDTECGPTTSAVGMHSCFEMGFLPVPYLWNCRDRYPHSVAWETRLSDGAMHLVNEAGAPLDVRARISRTLELNKTGRNHDRTH